MIRHVFILDLKFFIFNLVLLTTLLSCNNDVIEDSTLVSTQKELEKAIKESKPGTIIILKNGIWKDAAIVFYGEGSEEKPITLKAEKPGGVILEGNSSIMLGGSYLTVEGLYFKNGFTTKDAVIRFKINDTLTAFHSKITNCVIEDFTTPDRNIQNHWIELWGQHNSITNNYIAGKTNRGPTIRAFLEGNENINTYHQIKDNHFGPRPRRGGPQGETMQLGSSNTSMTPAYINVEHNYFERCNGEVEIISSKSNYNTFKNNVFFESEGSLVLRHGNYAIIEGNLFIGNSNSPYIGGIRVINTGHWIYNNYFYKLKGEEFRAALAVMNGIPKSPLNRYNQVTDVVVAYNTYDDCKTPWHFGVGANINQRDVLPASEIRSARAERMLVANNMIYNEQSSSPIIKTYDSITGVTFKKNITNSGVEETFTTEGIIVENLNAKTLTPFFKFPESLNIEPFKGYGFERIEYDFFKNKRSATNAIGAISASVPDAAQRLDARNYGTNWFDPNPIKAQAKSYSVSNSPELYSAIDEAASGDTIFLKKGNYVIDQTLAFDKEIIIKGLDTIQKPVFEFKEIVRAFELQPRAKLHLENVFLKGKSTTEAFETLDYNMAQAYELWLNHVEIEGFKSVLQASKSSFADTISIKNSSIKNTVSGILLNKETDDKGAYNAAFVRIENSLFDGVRTNVLDYYRGGYDESTIGGNLIIRGNTFTNSGSADEVSVLLKTRGIVNVKLRENKFINNKVKTIAVLWGAKGQKPVDNTLLNSGEIKVEENLKLKLVY